MILSETFPRWSDFGALVSHLKFARAHHEKIERVAAVADSKFADRTAALEWLRSDRTE